MYCQCGRGSRSTDAARVSHGKIGDLESAENMNRECCEANCVIRSFAFSNESALLK